MRNSPETNDAEQEHEVRWKTGSAKGYTDLFAVDLFAHDADQRTLQHEVVEPHGKLHLAKCRIVVAGRDALMDYTAFSAFNDGRGMELGVMQLSSPMPPEGASSRSCGTGERWSRVSLRS